jgi:hypothetical protein
MMPASVSLIDKNRVGVFLTVTALPREQISSARPATSVSCHKRTHAVEQKELLLNDLVRKTHVRKIEPKGLGGLEIDS